MMQFFFFARITNERVLYVRLRTESSFVQRTLRRTTYDRPPPSQYQLSPRISKCNSNRIIRTTALQSSLY